MVTYREWLKQALKEPPKDDKDAETIAWLKRLLAKELDLG